MCVDVLFFVQTENGKEYLKAFLKLTSTTWFIHQKYPGELSLSSSI